MALHALGRMGREETHLLSRERWGRVQCAAALALGNVGAKPRPGCWCGCRTGAARGLGMMERRGIDIKH